MPPQVIFGTATFGMASTEFQDTISVQNLFKDLQDLGIIRLDSAARYPPDKPGRSEELIGEARNLSKSFLIDTKVFTDMRTDGSGSLTPQAIQLSLDASLQRLQSDKVNILHTHRADPSTPLEEQVRGFNDQVQQGRCHAWGVSNVPPDMLEQMLKICEDKGLQKPSCYQGDYNVMTRGMESRLLPLLRAHDMTFNAFRPLAAGFLTGKFVNNDHAGTRFSDGHPIGKAVQGFFSAEDLHAAMKKFDVEVKSHGLTALEVAVRWIVHHSALTEKDGIILGASKTEQIQDTVSLIKKGPLPQTVLDITEGLWRAVKESRSSVI